MIFRNKFFLVGSAVLLLLACNKTKEIPEANLPRMFTPTGVKITLAETQVRIDWNPSLFSQSKQVSYTIQVSKDSTFQGTPDYSTTSDTTFVIVTDAQIAIRQKYFARIRANALDKTAESNWFVSTGFSMTGEQIFKVPVQEADIIDKAVILRWTTATGVNKIVLTPAGGGTPINIVITAGDNTAGFKLIPNLQANTTYIAEIFADTKSKGLLSFKTKATITGNSIIDLREITGRPSVLEDTIPLIPSGSIIILKRGVEYTISSTASLNKSFTILSGADFIPDLATIYFTNNFNLVAGSAIDSLVFKDLNLYSSDFNSKYVFNISQVGTIGKVSFENVHGHRFRGFFRMQTGGAGTQVTDFIMKNCVIDSLRDFSLVNANNSNTVANINVSNTTVYNARKVIDHRSPGSNSIKFNNCTFYNSPSGGPAGGGSFYFIDLNTLNSATPITITNCIFGQTWDEGSGNDANGIRAGGATTISISNSYQTSDFVSTNAAYQMAGLLPYPGTSSNLFTNPDNGNFKIKDNTFAGKGNSGDPRWY